MTTFKVKDLVFAKVRGYQPWPARIEAILGTGTKFKYCVTFYGTYDAAQIKPQNIFPYLENKEKFGTLKNAVIIQQKRKFLKIGLWEIENHPEILDDPKKKENLLVQSKKNRSLSKELQAPKTKEIRQPRPRQCNLSSGNNKRSRSYSAKSKKWLSTNKKRKLTKNSDKRVVQTKDAKGNKNRKEDLMNRTNSEKTSTDSSSEEYLKNMEQMEQQKDDESQIDNLLDFSISIDFSDSEQDKEMSSDEEIKKVKNPKKFCILSSSSSDSSGTEPASSESEAETTSESAEDLDFPQHPGIKVERNLEESTLLETKCKDINHQLKQALDNINKEEILCYKLLNKVEDLNIPIESMGEAGDLIGSVLTLQYYKGYEPISYKAKLLTYNFRKAYFSRDSTERKEDEVPKVSSTSKPKSRRQWFSNFL